jgi:hypothetical protein
MSLSDLIEGTKLEGIAKSLENTTTYKVADWYVSAFQEHLYKTIGGIVTYLPINIAADLSWFSETPELGDWGSVLVRATNITIMTCLIPVLLEGRNFLRDYLSVTDNSHKGTQGLVDGVYGFVTSSVIKAGIYFGNGARNLEYIRDSTLSGGLVTGVLSYFFMKFVEGYSETLKGNPTNKSVWNLLKNKSRTSRRNFALGYAALMITIAGSLYNFSDDNLLDFNRINPDFHQEQTEIVQQQNLYSSNFRDNIAIR